jgi:hypothetical protein
VKKNNMIFLLPFSLKNSVHKYVDKNKYTSEGSRWQQKLSQGGKKKTLEKIHGCKMGRSFPKSGSKPPHTGKNTAQTAPTEY